MSQEERLELADKLAADHTRLIDYVRTTTVLLGLLPVIYGGLTWLYGEGLWTISSIYATAMTVPGAPQSWGGLFIVVGTGVIVSAARRRKKCIAAFTLLAALILSMFMASFLTEWVTNDVTGALPPAVVYGVVSLLFLTRAHLAWAGRRRKNYGLDG